MDPITSIILFLVGMTLGISSVIVGEWGIGHFEVRRNMIPKPTRGFIRKWAYMQGHKSGVKRGR